MTYLYEKVVIWYITNWWRKKEEQEKRQIQQEQLAEAFGVQDNLGDSLKIMIGP